MTATVFQNIPAHIILFIKQPRGSGKINDINESYEVDFTRFEHSLLNQMSSSNLSHQGLGNCRKGGRKRVGAKERMEDMTETRPSRHNRTDVHMNPQGLWQEAQDLPKFKFKADGVSVLRRGHGHDLQSLIMKLSATDIHLQWKNQSSLVQSHWCITRT